jgi:hypothetical protein
MLPIGWWIWGGIPEGAATNDVSLVTAQKTEIKSLMDQRDLMIADRAFRSLRLILCILAGWIKKKRQDLEQWQTEENRQISEQRGNKHILILYYRFL